MKNFISHDLPLLLCVLVMTACNHSTSTPTIEGLYRVTKSVHAISEVPGPSENTALKLEKGGRFSVVDWPAWSLIPLNGGKQLLIANASGTWTTKSSNIIELQFAPSQLYPAGAVQLLSYRESRPPTLKVPINPGNEDDFIIMGRARE